MHYIAGEDVTLQYAYECSKCKTVGILSYDSSGMDSEILEEIQIHGLQCPTCTGKMVSYWKYIITPEMLKDPHVQKMVEDYKKNEIVWIVPRGSEVNC